MFYSLFSVPALGVEFVPVFGVMSLSSTEPAAAVGAKLRLARFEVSASSAGLKTSVYSMSSQMASMVIRYDVAKTLSGGAGAAGWVNTLRYEPPGEKSTTRRYVLYGPAFQLAYRPWKYFELGADYAYGIPGDMALLNTWASKGLIYCGVVF